MAGKLVGNVKWECKKKRAQEEETVSRNKGEARCGEGGGGGGGDVTGNGVWKVTTGMEVK